MLELVRDIVHNLIVLVLFVTLAQMLLPDNDLRKYTRIVLGLIVIVAVLQPLLDLQLDLERELQLGGGSAVTSGPVSDDAASRWVEQGQSLAVRAQERAAAQAEARLKTQVLSLVDLVPGAGAADARIRRDGAGEVQGVEITVTAASEASAPGASGSLDARVARVVSGFFGLSREQVRVHVREAAPGRAGERP